jgi:hypothetical protein
MKTAAGQIEEQYIFLNDNYDGPVKPDINMQVGLNSYNADYTISHSSTGIRLVRTAD